MAVPQQLFPTLSEANIKHRSETERRLPTWLSQPTQFLATNLINSAQDIDDFTDSIDQELINHIKLNLAVHKLFPVQKCLIPVLAKQFKSRPFRRPNDICVSSPTGSGKTLAYLIPIVNHLKQSLARELRAVVILPTRDLAQQVHKYFVQVTQPTHLRCAIATEETQNLFRRVPKYSKSDFHKFNASTALMLHDDGYPEDDYISTIDILISTPGHLVDLLQNSPGFTLNNLEILVIDEADRLMVNHKHNWLNALERGCTKPMHKLLFSATLSSDPQILMQMSLFQPRLFLATKPSITGTKIRLGGTPASTPGGSPAPHQAATCLARPIMGMVSSKSELLTTTAIPEQLEEKMFITEMKDKLFVMWYIMHELQYKNVLCFTNDKRKCYELFLFLNEIAAVRAVNFSSDIKPEIRQKYMSEFKKGQIEVIVATDLLGRGMDIDGVEYVISYDMPQSGTWYAHRVGRTARAGNKGTAITLVDSKQLVQFKKIVQMAHKMPNSMRLSDIVEEMKIPHMKRDDYSKVFENYKDKLNMKKAKLSRFKKQ